MSKRIITINRMYGSNGRIIGKALAEEMGIGFYDRELIELASSKSRFRSVSWQKWMKSGQVHGDSLLTVSCRSVLTVIRSP